MARSTRASTAAAGVASRRTSTSTTKPKATPNSKAGTGSSDKSVKSEQPASKTKRQSRMSVKQEDKQQERQLSHVKREDLDSESEAETKQHVEEATNSSKRSAPSSENVTRQSKRIKSESSPQKTGLLSPSRSASGDDVGDYDDDVVKQKAKSKSKSKSKTKMKTESSDITATTPTKDLSSKKLEAYFKNANKSPFPDFPHPTAAEAKLAHRILSSLHGSRTRPAEVVASKERAGCGDSPSVLDALVRTILSQNTSDTNSTRAKRNMDSVYGGSDNWASIVKGGQSKLQEAIKSGGLSVVKSKVIISILEQTRDKYGTYSLDHLHKSSNEAAMREMLSFQGVGPKTASCVLLFCLQRESFAVDTHVHRITGLLGWRPKTASRDETHAHLDAMIPDEDKYGLHILLVKHGKVCEECRAGGKNVGKCELRKAFQAKNKSKNNETVKVEGEVKDEDGDEEDIIKEEEEEDGEDEDSSDDDED